MHPDKTRQRPPKHTSRLRSAWHALRGEPVVPESIRAEWVAWQFEFEAVLDKLSAAAARLYTRDKVALKVALKRLEELDQDTPAVPVAVAYPTGGWNPAKRALNRQVLAMQGVRIPDTFGREQAHVDGDQSLNDSN